MLIKIDRDRLFRWLFAGLLIAELAIVLLDALISESGWVSIGAARRFSIIGYFKNYWIKVYPLLWATSSEAHVSLFYDYVSS